MSNTELQQVSEDRWLVVHQETGFQMGEITEMAFDEVARVMEVS